jgi:hypothetical protein
MVNSSEELSDLYKLLIKECEDEIALKEKEKLRWEQLFNYNLAYNCTTRIEELNQKISDYKSKLAPHYEHDSLHKDLLRQDFLHQKERFNNKAVKQANFIVLQGTPTCGLQYFIAHQHSLKKPALVNCIKAATIQPNENNFCEAIWNAIGSKLGIEFDETSEIRTRLKEKLKEQSIAMVFYDVQDWTDLGSDFLQKLKSVADFWKETKHEIKPFYCYFVYLKLPELTDDKESDVIILPPVECLEDNELRQLRANYDHLFCKCPIDPQALSGNLKLHDVIEILCQFCKCPIDPQALSGNLKLHDVIEIFCKDSIYRQELYKCFQKYQYFS